MYIRAPKELVQHPILHRGPPLPLEGQQEAGRTTFAVRQPAKYPFERKVFKQRLASLST